MNSKLVKLVFTLALIFSFTVSRAQVSVSVNIGLQPDWGPVGYDYVEYYYIPAYEVYYYVPKREFVYLEGTRWIFAPALPARFGRVDLYTPYKVVINEPKAYLHFKEHQVKYVRYKSAPEKQVIIRDSKDPKYTEARKHEENNNSKANSPHNEPAKVSDEHHNAEPAKKENAPSKNQNNSKGKEDKKGKHPDEGGPK